MKNLYLFVLVIATYSNLAFITALKWRRETSFDDLYSRSQNEIFNRNATKVSCDSDVDCGDDICTSDGSCSSGSSDCTISSSCNSGVTGVVCTTYSSCVATTPPTALPTVTRLPNIGSTIEMNLLATSMTIILSVNSKNISRIVGVDQEHQFLDNFGRQKFFRGLNVVYKGAPYYPVVDKFNATASFTEKDAQILQSVNMNVIRLGVLWAGVEPIRGKYNDTYLDIIRGIVDNCKKYGIYVLLDSHQDIMSQKFCGDGFPNWASMPGLLPFPLPVHLPIPFKDGNPIPDRCPLNWASLYESNAVSVAWQNLYDNHNGLLNAFAAQWAYIAQKFKDVDNVLGYDIINEPWAGNVFADPKLYDPKIAEKNNIQRLLEKVNTAIRKVDDKTVLFYAGVTWDNFGNELSVPGGDNYKNRSALSYHYYQLPQFTGAEVQFVKKTEDINRAGGGQLLTEFDASWNSGKNIADLLDLTQKADKYLVSWIGWQYKDFGSLRLSLRPGVSDEGLINKDTGEIRPEMAKLFSRTYPESVAGKTQKYFFNDTDSHFYLLYQIDPSIKAPTVIRVQTLYHYPKGLHVTVSPAEKVNITQDVNLVYLDAVEGKAQKDDLITVNIITKQ
ncbi:7477_t:CDS:2 [Ambispora leptoticha]|uniref:7477_t:CDS:1 n=1 Tax=Ambispora leptoticha TaxID=144679 RepID=A0A9N9BB92_9GLOM|nr:7477_t:CDS:2 [Ambispora leptoticha]